MIEAIKNDELKFDKHKEVSLSNSCKDIITKLLHKHPAFRLGSKSDVQDLKNHRFFKSIDFDKLEKREIQAPFKPRVTSDFDVSQIDESLLEQYISTSDRSGSSSFVADVSGATDDDHHHILGFTYSPRFDTETYLQ